MRKESYMGHNFVTKERALIVIISEKFLPKYICPFASDEAKSTRRQILNRSLIAWKHRTRVSSDKEWKT
jgi:hypothetical protein